MVAKSINEGQFLGVQQSAVAVSKPEVTPAQSAAEDQRQRVGSLLAPGKKVWKELLDKEAAKMDSNKKLVADMKEAGIDPTPENVFIEMRARDRQQALIAKLNVVLTSTTRPVRKKRGDDD